jgi:hypothetical protein
VTQIVEGQILNSSFPACRPERLFDFPVIRSGARSLFRFSYADQALRRILYTPSGNKEQRPQRCAQQYESSSFFEVSFSRKKAQNHHVVFCLFMANAVWPTLFPKIIDFPGGHAYYLCGLEIDPQVNSSQTQPR